MGGVSWGGWHGLVLCCNFFDHNVTNGHQWTVPRALCSCMRLLYSVLCRACAVLSVLS